ncbi:MAG TPA: peptide-N4-asparagine amidase, partial [Candidatus Angelobacter sp.]
MKIFRRPNQSTISFPLPAVRLIMMAVLLSASAVSFGQAIPASGLQIGSPNTATADPPVPRPETTPCVVQLFSNIAFADFSPKLFSFTPPAACPGPWAKVVLEADFSIQAGRQFDRTANIWIGGTNVYFGTTSEPSATVARSWHIERDLTDYNALFASPQNGSVDLGNLVNSTFTSVLFGTAELQFYPLERRHDVPRTADLVLPLSSSSIGGSVFLNTFANPLSQTFTLPRNVEQAFLDVIAQSQANDEFWYTCVPNDVAAELQSCGSTAFRESEVTIDGQPAGVAPVYPWIYTGGIDPLLWRPIPGVQALNFVPYRVDLTPFAGLLSNGQPHQVSLNVFNTNVGFSTTATLMVFLDHGSTQVTGEVTENTIGSGPTPNVAENLTNTNGNITGSVTVTSSRSFRLAGFVRTSHGRVETRMQQDIQFSNRQDFNITNTVFVQNITQLTTISSITNRGRGGEEDNEDAAVVQKLEWPLQLDFSFVVNPDGSGSQTTTIQQAFNKREVSPGDDGHNFSVVSNSVSPSDTLLFDSSFNITGHQNQGSTQRYFSKDSEGGCFSRTITAASGLLTNITDGVGCKDRDDH